MGFWSRKSPKKEKASPRKGLFGGRKKKAANAEEAALEPPLTTPVKASKKDDKKEASTPATVTSSPAAATTTKTTTKTTSTKQAGTTTTTTTTKKPAPKAATPAKKAAPAATSAPAAAAPAKAASSSAPVSTGDKKWDYLYELAVQYDQHKLQEAEEKKSQIAKPVAAAPAAPAEPSRDNIKGKLEGLIGDSYTANGNWLNKEFVTKYLTENKKFKSLAFKFSDPKLFKKFDKTDEKNRNAIITKFVDNLLSHPRAKEITEINLSNSLLPDQFLVELSDRVLKDSAKNLPKLQVLNLESNALTEEGLVAISKVISDDNAWRYLQILKLENQKVPFSSTAEEVLAEAVAKSPSIVVCSLRVRGAMQRQQINTATASNIDSLRQARREHAAKTGTLKERKRNEMEQMFDKIAANDASITEVDLVGNPKVLALNSAEKIKAGAAFTGNTHVKTIKMVKLQLDDKFAEALGKALEGNSTVEKVLLDSNSFSGEGIKSLFAGLGKSTSIVEFQVRHQSKKISSADEEGLPALVETNKSVIKLGVDLRNQFAKMKLERMTADNREYQRKLRVEAKKAAAAAGK